MPLSKWKLSAWVPPADLPVLLPVSRHAGGQLAPRSQGQGLVTAMREVPAVFFQEKFELGDSELWATAFDEGGRQEALERLSHNLVSGHRASIVPGHGLSAPP